MYLLSKSSYMKGWQCPKALWLYRNRKDLLPETSLQKQAMLDTGKEVGRLARQLFPDGVDCSPVSPVDFGPSLATTQEAIAKGASVLYEAAFQHDGVLAAADILVRTANGWHAIEAKSSSGIKDEHIQDMALQSHVVQGAGLSLTDVSIAHINTSYVRQGAIDVQRLFTVSSVKAKVDVERIEVPARIASLKTMLAAEAGPTLSIGPYCDDPHPCDFHHHCWEHVPKERSVFDLTRGGKRVWGLYERGILRLEDIPSDEKLTPTQQVQVDGWKRDATIMDRARIAEFVQSLQYPLYHLDFETFNPAIPMYEGTRPYQQVPFQSSLHMQASPVAEPIHKAFLGDGTGDPREAFIEQLLNDLGPTGDILTYNVVFERGRLTELAHDLPHHAIAIASILPRLKDLMLPFQKGWLYLPAMNGSYSIKKVLPALVPELDYSSLNVKEGETVSLLYGQLCSGLFTGDVEQLRADLLAYCAMDTMAMVRVHEVLRASCA